MPVPPFHVDQLPDDWSEVDAMRDGDLEVELVREVRAGHTLHGHRATAVAVRRHRKDVIYWLPDVRLWALVHLTWTAEIDPRWPSTVTAAEWESIVAEVSS
jgi:hypothetical protein